MTIGSETPKNSPLESRSPESDTAEISEPSAAVPLPWGQIDTVLLDMDGTLLDLHFDNYFWLQHVPLCYAEKHELPHDEAHAQLMQRYGAARGSLDWYCVEYWTRELALDIGSLKHDIAEKIAVRPDVIEFLQWLNAHDKRVVLVTNAHPVSLDLKMQKTGLHVHFDNIINAHDIGLAKENDGFWEKLHDYEPYDKTRTLLIDDNLEVLQSAHDYGVRYCYGIEQPDSRGDTVKSRQFAVLGSIRDVLPSD